jgi:uncharacterized protein YqjF (DUF2071 family)
LNIFSINFNSNKQLFSTEESTIYRRLNSIFFTILNKLKANILNMFLTCNDVTLSEWRVHVQSFRVSTKNGLHLDTTAAAAAEEALASLPLFLFSISISPSPALNLSLPFPPLPLPLHPLFR